MKNHDIYLENCLEYSSEGMDISSACDKAIAVDYLGEEFINGLGDNTAAVIHFVKIVHNYMVMEEKLKEL